MPESFIYCMSFVRGRLTSLICFANGDMITFRHEACQRIPSTSIDVYVFDEINVNNPPSLKIVKQTVDLTYILMDTAIRQKSYVKENGHKHHSTQKCTGNAWQLETVVVLSAARRGFGNACRT